MFASKERLISIQWQTKFCEHPIYGLSGVCDRRLLEVNNLGAHSRSAVVLKDSSVWERERGGSIAQTVNTAFQTNWEQLGWDTVNKLWHLFLLVGYNTEHTIGLMENCLNYGIAYKLLLPCPFLTVDKFIDG